MRAQVLLLLAASAHATTLLSLRGGAKEKVAIIGSGNWGSAIAKVVGRNVIESDEFDAEVRMWVFEEEVKDRTGTPRKLTEIINQHHENVKYLPGIKLPDNVIADPDLRSAVQDASLLVFVLPHQFLGRICPEMTSHRRGARAISLIKGIEFDDKGPVLISSMIKEAMGGMDVSVLMGANVASEVAKDEFCESTVGYSNKKNGAVWQRLFDAPRFKVGKIEDVAGVELCGALKNVVALGAGFCDGLGYGGNTKAAIIRIGLEETSRFSKMFFKNVKEATFMESCIEITM
jgi:glycerol-3-phosphate dehydrogenase (NAD+)